MARSYIVHTEIVEKITTYLIKMRKRGIEFVPSERELSDTFGASRMTVRKALEQLENRGTILKGARSRITADPGTVPIICRAAFVAAGRERIGNPARERLWNHLKEIAPLSGISINLALFGWDEPVSKLHTWLKKAPQFIVFANVPDENHFQTMLEARTSHTVIAVDEGFADRFSIVVGLDNFAAGYAAGQLLLNAGYENPVYVGSPPPFTYAPFQKRVDGFAAAFSEKGKTASFLWTEKTRAPEYIPELPSVVKKALSRGHDAMFLFSDEGIDVAYAALAAERAMPDEFGLITLNGRGDVLRHNPPITAVGHASRACAQRLVDTMLRIRTSASPDACALLLEKPDIHEGVTVRSKIKTHQNRKSKKEFDSA